MEGRISWTRGCSQSAEGVCYQRLAEDYPSESPVVLSIPEFIGTLIVTRAEVLQGVRDVEDSSSSECATTARGHNDRDPVRDGVRMDDKWKHQ